MNPVKKPFKFTAIAARVYFQNPTKQPSPKWNLDRSKEERLAAKSPFPEERCIYPMAVQCLTMSPSAVAVFHCITLLHFLLFSYSAKNQCHHHFANSTMLKAFKSQTAFQFTRNMLIFTSREGMQNTNHVR